MLRAAWMHLLAAVVVSSALNCNSSQPEPEHVQESARAGTAVGSLSGDGCDSCLDIHLGDYNLFLREDFAGGCDVGGKVAVGGNIHMNGFSLGSQLPDGDLSHALVAGGDLTLKACGVRGDAWYGGSYTADTSVVCGRPDCTATRGAPIDFEERFVALRALSSRMATQPINGTTRFQYGVMSMSGTAPCVNVFEANASDLTALWRWDFDVPAGSFVVLNIRGEAPTFPTDIQFNGGLTAQRVLYNLVEATRVTLHNAGFSGTLLAPRARVTVQDGAWSGGVYAVAMSCAGGFSLGDNPLDELAGGAPETCNGVDDNCDGKVDEDFECTGSGHRGCTTWCGAEGTQTCDPATCEYGECTSSRCCRTDTDCAGASSYCEGTTCVAQKGNGAACGSAHECASGECVDGVCCDTACAGACDACNLTGHVGTCSMAPPTVQCRASGGACDVAEYCTGSSALCPTDGSAPNGQLCGTGSTSDWSLCGGFSGTCGLSGARSRSVTTQVCSQGTCQSSASTETQSCSRDTNGNSCDAPTYGAWGTCTVTGSICGTTGTQSRSVTAYVCSAGGCSPVSSTETRSCSLSTQGNTCGATAYGPWGVCTATGGTCGTTGTQSRSTTTYSCSGGSCSPSYSTETRSCSLNTDGSSCRTPSYGAWSTCTGNGGTCSTTGTQYRSVTAYYCSGGGCGGSYSYTESQNCTVNTQGSSCSPPSYGAWSACSGGGGACSTSGTRSRSVTTYACSSGSCAPSGGYTEAESCGRNPAGESCNDGDACTTSDTCSSSGTCSGSQVQCSGGMVCSNGSCTCPGGSSWCNGQCINTSNDAANCGTCGRVCPCGRCLSGVCQLPATGCHGAPGLRDEAQEAPEN